MPRVPDKTKQLMKEMYSSGLSVAEIARRANVPYSTAYGYTRARQRGFASYGEYQAHLARQRGFASKSEYQEHLAKQRGFASRSEYQEHLAKQRGFASRSEYEAHLARQRGFASKSEYQAHLARQRGFASRSEYQAHLAKQRRNPETQQPFKSLTELQDYLARQRQERPENQGLSDLIRRRLKELGKNQSWLARQIGVTENSVSEYARGRFVPKREVLGRLYSALDVPYQTLEELLE